MLMLVVSLVASASENLAPSHVFCCSVHVLRLVIAILNFEFFRDLLQFTSVLNLCLIIIRYNCTFLDFKRKH